MILQMRSKTDKLLTVLDWDYTHYLSKAAADCIDLALYRALNGYSISPSFQIPVSRYLAYNCNLVSPQLAAIVKLRTMSCIKAGAGGVWFYNLPMEPTRLPQLNGMAQAFGMTCTHTGVTYPKDFGN